MCCYVCGDSYGHFIALPIDLTLVHVLLVMHYDCSLISGDNIIFVYEHLANLLAPDIACEMVLYDGTSQGMNFSMQLDWTGWILR